MCLLNAHNSEFLVCKGLTPYPSHLGVKSKMLHTHTHTHTHTQTHTPTMPLTHSPTHKPHRYECLNNIWTFELKSARDDLKPFDITDVLVRLPASLVNPCFNQPVVLSYEINKTKQQNLNHAILPLFLLSGHIVRPSGFLKSVET